MMYIASKFNIFIITLSLILFVWVCMIIIRRLINKSKFGNIILKTKQPYSVLFVVIGVSHLMIAVLHFFQYKDSHLFLSFIVYFVTAFIFFYNGLSYIEIRERGIFLFNRVLKWEEIKDSNSIDNEFKLVLNKPVILKQIRFTIRKNDREEFIRLLDEKISN